MMGGAHPRSRGEHLGDKAGKDLGEGSSPLTRGALRPPQRLNRPCGLIPAHAGSTTPPSATAPAATAHPRSRGEHSSQPATTAVHGLF
ncbi:hypothetical protein HMPREF0307_02212 [Corynebacterium sp. DNF00584]|nr:hypothetical protein HMPREF0307_02212 [Corynebacterium sp. DNF00584]